MGKTEPGGTLGVLRGSFKIGPPGKASLRKHHVSKDLKWVGEPGMRSWGNFPGRGSSLGPRAKAGLVRQQ